MAIDLYVIIVSEHNLAELRACLYLQPTTILMVSSHKMQAAAQRLLGVLQKQLPHTKVEVLTSTTDTPFSGDYLQENQQWLERIFLPKLAQIKPSSAQLNMTGGTKILAYLLTRIYPWQEIHYQPLADTIPLERFYTQNDSPHLLPTIDLATAATSDISPDNHALLYMDYVRPHSPNIIRKHPDSLAIALLRLETQQANNPHQGLGAFIALFEQAWSLPTQEPFVNMPIPPNTHLDESLLARLNNLYIGSHAAPLTRTPEGLQIPAAHHKKYTDWRKWISGDWYEQLIEQWLLDYGIDKKHLLSNVQLSNKTDPQGQESDTLLQYKNKLYVIEIKADVPQSKQLGDMENQLSSLAMQLGKVENVLILSPAIRRRY
ncbi:MAG TPA: hypothetical protein PKC44_13765, partial [Agitococcus sp.]|nr:hypothetical protein [Agitococcus sp.]